MSPILASLLLLGATAAAQIQVGGAPGAGPFHEEPRGDGPDFAPPSGNPYVLAFAGGDHVPEPGVDPRLLRHPDGHAWVYIMLKGRVTDPRRLSALRSLGVELRSVHTWQSWVARVPTRSVPAIARLDFVHWIGWPRPEQKLSPQLVRQALAAAPDKELRISVRVFESDLDASATRQQISRGSEGERQTEIPLFVSVPHGPIRAELERGGFVFDGYSQVSSAFVFAGRAIPSAIVAIAKLPIVAAVEAAFVGRGTHDQSMSMIGQDAVRGFFGGAGTTIGIIDSGLWSPGLAQRHLDFQQKWLLGFDTVGTGAFDDQNGHGTHVAGTICGAGLADARYRGAAITAGNVPIRPLFVARYLDQNNNTSGGGGPLYEALSKDYGAMLKPRIVNNSWGSSGSWVGTDEISAFVDQYSFDNDQLYVFAAGNSGANGTTYQPAVAKNMLTVGAVSDEWPGATEPGDMMSFSSRGTADGRRKPEVLAPGGTVTSTNTKSVTGYQSLSGTSQAAAHVTGALASLVEHYPQWFDYRPAVLKAHACAVAEWQGQAGFIDGWHGMQQGWGVIDAVKMHGSARTGWQVGWGTLAQSGDWTYWDVAVPANAVHAKCVLAWLEPMASEGAAAARLDDIRLIVDLPGFDASGQAGEIFRSSDQDTVLGIAGTDFANQIKGQVIRVKAYGESVPATAKLGMSIVWMTADPQGTVGMDLTLAKDVIQLNETTAALAVLQSGAATHHFDNARFEYVDTAGFTVTALARSGLDGVFQAFLGNHPSDPFPSLLTGMTVGSGLQRQLWFVLRGDQEGVWPVQVRSFYDPLDRSKSVTRQLCVDSSPPDDLAGLGSTSHQAAVWSVQTTAVMQWQPATDRGCGGIGGLAWSVSQGSTNAPPRPSLPPEQVVLTVLLSASAQPQFFNLRAFDRAGNGSRTASFGPLFVDNVSPVLAGIEINGGARSTSEATVTVAVRATDANSGVSEMRLGSDAVWGPWQPFAERVAADLTREPWRPGPGEKLVRVQVRDRALGVSNEASATIVYGPLR